MLPTLLSHNIMKSIFATPTPVRQHYCQYNDSQSFTCAFYGNTKMPSWQTIHYAVPSAFQVACTCSTTSSVSLTHTHCMFKPTMCEKPMSLTIHFLEVINLLLRSYGNREIFCSLILTHTCIYTCTLTHADILIGPV